MRLPPNEVPPVYITPDFPVQDGSEMTLEKLAALIHQHKARASPLNPTPRTADQWIVAEIIVDYTQVLIEELLSGYNAQAIYHEAELVKAEAQKDYCRGCFGAANNDCPACPHNGEGIGGEPNAES